MLISEFARKTGLTIDAVRFYVRRGLLTPEMNGKGGRNPYQVFTAEHVRAAKLICTAQSLGLSLKDLAAIGKERQAGRLTPEFSIAILSAQLGKLETRATELKTMTRYLRAKIDWIAGDEAGQPGRSQSKARKARKPSQYGIRPNSS